MISVRRHTLFFSLMALVALGVVGAVAGGRWLWGANADETVFRGAPERFRAREITPDEAARTDLEAALALTQGPAGDKGKVHYFADGCSLADPASPNRQATWVCIFNPSHKPARLKATFYYEESEPTSLAWEVAAESAQSINLFERREVLPNQRFGAKIESSEAVVAQVSTGYFGARDKKDWFTRAMHSVICAPGLERVHAYADGLVIDREGLRLREPEWVFLLNPHSETARVHFHACYANGEKKIYALEIAPQRLFPLLLDDLVVKNRLFGARFVSSLPLAIQQTRWVLEEDRKTIRAAFSVMAAPWEKSESPRLR